MGLIRPLVALLAGRLPGTARARLLEAIGWQVDPSASLGFGWIDAESVVLGPRARIGHLNSVRGVAELRLGAGASIGSLNEIVGVPGAPSSITLAAGAAIVSRHYLDVSGGLEMGEYATLAGRESQIWTHDWPGRGGGRSIRRSSVRLSAQVYVGARAMLMAGVELPEDSTVGAGAVVSAPVAAGSKPGDLLVGNPAEARRRA